MSPGTLGGLSPELRPLELLGLHGTPSGLSAGEIEAPVLPTGAPRGRESCPCLVCGLDWGLRPGEVRKKGAPPLLSPRAAWGPESGPGGKAVCLPCLPEGGGGRGPSGAGGLVDPSVQALGCGLWGPRAEAFLSEPVSSGFPSDHRKGCCSALGTLGAPGCLSPVVPWLGWPGYRYTSTGSLGTK